jgi:hypothetical protein
MKRNLRVATWTVLVACLFFTACTPTPQTAGPPTPGQPTTQAAQPTPAQPATVTAQATPAQLTEAVVEASPAQPTEQPVQGAPAQPGALAVAPNFGCFNTPHVTATLPLDTPVSQQPEVNCFAWQSFIALNWAADPNNRGQPDLSQTAQNFGQPDDLSAGVWQTYKLPEDVFLSGAAPPAPWEQADTLPKACQPLAQSQDLDHLVVLPMLSKFGDLIPDEVQATGQVLIDQDRNLVRYEKRFNQDEYNYIVQKQLYNANTQAAVAAAEGIVLPAGSTEYGPSGAIEIKAAWRVLDGEAATITNRYKKTMALLYDPSTNTCSGPTLMGLVGLHIIRKTPNLQQISWSTFEQVDNVPAGQPHDESIPYSFYSPTCQAPAPCTANATPAPTPAPPATPTFEPVQVERVQQLEPDVQALNLAAQQMITQTNPGSVWQYYQLINVRWAKNNDPNFPAAGMTINEVATAISRLGFTSSGPQPVNNVTMETYVQGFDCLSCHAGAAIAPSQSATCDPSLVSDFSFVFDNADTPDHYQATQCKQQADPGAPASDGETRVAGATNAAHRLGDTRNALPQDRLCRMCHD